MTLNHTKPNQTLTSPVTLYGHEGVTPVVWEALGSPTLSKQLNVNINFQWIRFPYILSEKIF